MIELKINPITIRLIQEALHARGLYDGPLDGIAGTKTVIGLDSYERMLSHPRPESGRIFDDRSEKSIATLLPFVQGKAREFLGRVLAAGHIIKIIDGNRTYAQQDAIFNQAHDGKDNDADGRVDEPDECVTRAQGGKSNHNFGVAFDIGVFSGDGKYVPESPVYDAVGQIGKAVGFNWGGDWKSIVDKPHFEWPTGLSMAEMRERVAQGKPILSV